MPFLGIFTHCWARQMGGPSRCSLHLSHVDAEPGDQERTVTPPCHVSNPTETPFGEVQCNPTTMDRADRNRTSRFKDKSQTWPSGSGRRPDLNVRREAAAIGVCTEHYMDSKKKVAVGQGRLLGRGSTCPDDFWKFTRRKTPDKRESQNQKTAQKSTPGVRSTAHSSVFLEDGASHETRSQWEPALTGPHAQTLSCRR